MVSTIAVGLDGSKTAAKALEMAVEIARRFDANVVLPGTGMHDPRRRGAAQAMVAHKARCAVLIVNTK